MSTLEIIGLVALTLFLIGALLIWRLIVVAGRAEKAEELEEMRYKDSY